MKKDEDLRRTIKDQRRHLGALNQKVFDLTAQRNRLIQGLVDISHEHGLKNTVNGIFEEAGLSVRISEVEHDHIL